MLLTADDLDDRARYLNVRNTLLTLLEFGAVPIINENDTVSVEELQTTFGDNDRLAAMVTNLIRAPLLVLLSDVEGLYDGDPRQPGAKLIRSRRRRLDEWIFSARARQEDRPQQRGHGQQAQRRPDRHAVGRERDHRQRSRSLGVLARIIAGE